MLNRFLYRVTLLIVTLRSVILLILMLQGVTLLSIIPLTFIRLNVVAP
jgi:hypothetical protein